MMARILLLSYLFLRPDWRREIERNYRKVFQKDACPSFWIKNAWSLGKNLGIMLQIGKKGFYKILDKTEINGENILYTKLKEYGKVLVVSFHFGPWELLPQVFARLGPAQISIVTTPQKDKRFHQMVQRLRISQGVKVLSNSTQVLRNLTAKSRTLLGFLLDNTKQGPQIELAGLEGFNFNATPFLLSERRKIPILPMIIYKENSRLKVEIDDVAQEKIGYWFSSYLNRYPTEWLFWGKG